LKCKEQVRTLASALHKLKEASYELERGMTAAATQAEDRLRAIVDAILPAFDHHGNFQILGNESTGTFMAAVKNLGGEIMALRTERDDLLREARTAHAASRSASLTLEQGRDQARVSIAQLTERIRGQADDVRGLQEGRVNDRAEFGRLRQEQENEIAHLKAFAERVDDSAMQAAERDEVRLTRAREELRVVQQTNLRLQAEVARCRPAAGDGGDLSWGGGDTRGETPLPGWSDLTELKRELISADTRANRAEARAAAAEASLQIANNRSMAAAMQAAARTAARTGSGTFTFDATSGANALSPHHEAERRRTSTIDDRGQDS
jgi:hypothetical protein